MAGNKVFAGTYCLVWFIQSKKCASSDFFLFCSKFYQGSDSKVHTASQLVTRFNQLHTSQQAQAKY